MKKYAYFLLIFMVALFAAIGSEFKESGTVAKYLSKIDGSDSARVAKWDISAVDKDGESIVMVAESRTVPSGSGALTGILTLFGGWLLQMSCPGGLYMTLDDNVLFLFPFK